jgi:hypothetical protein
MERSKSRMRVFAWRVDVSGEGRQAWAWDDDKTARSLSCTKQSTEQDRTGG